MNLGEHITILRKRKKLSQSKLGSLVNISGDTIGRYERGTMVPSIEAIIKISNALDVSIDYLVGKISQEIDQNTMERLEKISQLSTDRKQYVFQLIDMCLRDFKTQQSYR